MFLNKVHDQKVELMRAVFRNMYLKEKCDYLDGECKMLAEHILSCQVTRAEKDEINTTLRKDLNTIRQLNEQKLHELASTNEQIMSVSQVLENSNSAVSSSLNENMSIDEELQVKNEMIKCLQDELIHVRLEAAEKWALIRELRQIRDELEKDKEMLTKTKPETISRLQEKLIGGKLLESQYTSEFANIKKQLQAMKAELHTRNQNQNSTNKSRKAEGSVKLSKMGVLWLGKNKNQDNEIVEEIKKLEKEKFYLENRMPELENKIDILNKHIKFKEEERCKLQEKLDNARLKQQSIENITIERRRQYDHLQSSASEKVVGIRNSCNNKKQNIDELSSKFQQIANRRQSYTSACTIKELNTILSLEENISILEQRINQLNHETTKLQETCNGSDENIFCNDV
jgi:chromosome segregation ATPase